MKISYYLKIILIIIVFSIVSFSAYSQENTVNAQTDSPSQELKRSFGDLFVGFEITAGVGLTDYYYNDTYTSFSHKDHFYYGIGVQAEFFFAPYFSLILGTAAQYFTFMSRASYINGSTTSIKSIPYSQWFHQAKITTRFYYWKFLYAQTGFVLLAHYGSSFFERLSGVKGEVNTTIGASLRWQIGLGSSIAVGKDNSNSFDFGINFYVPITGKLINYTAQDAGGTNIHLKSDTLLMELFIGTSFKL